MKLQPLADRVIVKPLDAEETTKGGIVLPDTAKEKPQEGKIIAVGKGKRLDAGGIQSVALGSCLHRGPGRPPGPRGAPRTARCCPAAFAFMAAPEWKPARRSSTVH